MGNTLSVAEIAALEITNQNVENIQKPQVQPKKQGSCNTANECPVLHPKREMSSSCPVQHGDDINPLNMVTY